MRSRLNTLDDHVDGLSDQAVQMENYAIRLEDRLGGREEDNGINRRDFNQRLDTLSNEMSMARDELECLHYGLVENGGFRRRRVLDNSMRESMFTIERANLVMHNNKRKWAEDTEPNPEPGDECQEGAEEEGEEEDESIDLEAPSPADGEVETEPNPMEHNEVDQAGATEMEVDYEAGRNQHAIEDLKKELNSALSREDYVDAARVQATILELLDRAAAATSGGAAEPSSSTS